MTVARMVVSEVQDAGHGPLLPRPMGGTVWEPPFSFSFLFLHFLDGTKKRRLSAGTDVGWESFQRNPGHVTGLVLLTLEKWDSSRFP